MERHGIRIPRFSQSRQRSRGIFEPKLETDVGTVTARITMTREATVSPVISRNYVRINFEQIIIHIGPRIDARTYFA